MRVVDAAVQHRDSHALARHAETVQCFRADIRDRFLEFVPINTGRRNTHHGSIGPKRIELGTLDVQENRVRDELHGADGLRTRCDARDPRQERTLFADDCGLARALAFANCRCGQRDCNFYATVGLRSCQQC